MENEKLEYLRSKTPSNVEEWILDLKKILIDTDEDDQKEIKFLTDYLVSLNAYSGAKTIFFKDSTSENAKVLYLNTAFIISSKCVKKDWKHRTIKYMCNIINLCRGGYLKENIWLDELLKKWVKQIKTINLLYFFKKQRQKRLVALYDEMNKYRKLFKKCMPVLVKQQEIKVKDKYKIQNEKILIIGWITYWMRGIRGSYSEKNKKKNILSRIKSTMKTLLKDIKHGAKVESKY